MLLRLILMVLAGPAFADGPIAEVVCGTRADVVARLTGPMRAERVGAGLRDGEALVEVWASKDGDWTLVQTWADGRACILAMGEAWEAEAGS